MTGTVLRYNFVIKRMEQNNTDGFLEGTKNAMARGLSSLKAGYGQKQTSMVIEDI